MTGIEPHRIIDWREFKEEEMRGCGGTEKADSKLTVRILAWGPGGFLCHLLRGGRMKSSWEKVMRLVCKGRV
jgi:hypothetical protein